jgi:hypothetical protein
MVFGRNSWAWVAVVTVAVVVVSALPAHAQKMTKETRKRIELRVKVVSVEPLQPVEVMAIWGGRGLGGNPTVVKLDLLEPAKAKMVAGLEAKEEEEFAMPHELGKDPAAKDTVRDERTGQVYLKPGVWSRPNSMSKLAIGFVEFYLEGKDKPVTKMTLAFEFTVDGKVVKTFEEHAEAGNKVTIVTKNGDPTSTAWADRAMGITEYTRNRAKMLEELPWSGNPIPQLISVATDCGGWESRHTSYQVLEAEARSLAQLGVNGLRAGAALMEKYMNEVPASKGRFGWSMMTHGGSTPVVRINVNHQTGKITSVPPEGGCPWAPGVPGRAVEGAASEVKRLSAYKRYETVWVRTVDEIGSIYGGAAEGKAHMSVCPDCQKAFKQWMKDKGFTPEYFDCKSWDEVKNIAYPNARLWAEVDAEEKRIAREKLEALPGVKDNNPMVSLKPEDTADVFDLTVPKKASAKGGKTDKGGAAAGAQAGHGAAGGGGAAGAGRAAEVDLADEDAENEPEPMVEKIEGAGTMSVGKKRLLYWSHAFSGYSTGKMFTRLYQEMDKHNKARQALLDKGDKAGAAELGPFLYSFALRGNTFLMAGGSLDFFDFYRDSDNAMVYETSNRDARVWQWDSYLCEVGRSLRLNMDKKFGVYVKPHRGAAVQRILAAVARGATFVFLYTYGPDYSKGDSFSQSVNAMTASSKGMHLVGKSEHLIVGAEFEQKPQVAVVRDATSNSAEWEDGKWVWAALMHSHVPMDALDQVMLTTNDLSQYKAIYVTGGRTDVKVVKALKKYVEQGGVLYTGAGGLAFDDGQAPIAEMEEMFGVQGRTPAKLWGGPIRRYGATGLGTFSSFGKAPEGLELIDSPQGKLIPVVGHEAIKVAPGKAQVVAKFSDGSPAMVVNSVGKGKVYLSAVYPGLEYAAKVHRPDFNMPQDFDGEKRAWVTAAIKDRVTVPVDVSVPVVEAISLVHAKTGKRSVVLMNWGYETGKKLVPQENVKLTITNGKGVTKVKSMMLDQELVMEKKGESVVVTLPRIEEGDVLAVE